MRSPFIAAFAFLNGAALAEEPSIEIAGVTITRGMPEKDVREAFHKVYCVPNAPDSCSVGDGIPPEYDGEMTFENGRVRGAARNLPIPSEDQEC